MDLPSLDTLWDLKGPNPSPVKLVGGPLSIIIDTLFGDLEPIKTGSFYSITASVRTFSHVLGDRTCTLSSVFVPMYLRLAMLGC